MSDAPIKITPGERMLLHAVLTIGNAREWDQAKVIKKVELILSCLETQFAITGERKKNKKTVDAAEKLLRDLQINKEDK